MDHLLKLLAQYTDIERYSESKRSLFIIILLFLVFFLFLFSAVDFTKLSYPHWIIIILILIVISTFWALNRRIPHCKHGHIGFAVAILCENKEDELRIKNDFISHLKQLLDNANFATKLDFRVLSEYWTSQITSVEKADEIRKRIKANFFVFGRICVREIGDKPHNVLKLEAIVSHEPMPVELSKQLSNEFSQIFPRKLYFSRDKDIFLFEYTSEWITLVAQYVIGIASYLSLDTDYAEILYTDLKAKLLQCPLNIPAINHIRKIIPSRLIEVYLFKSAFLHLKWIETRDVKCLEEKRKYSKKILDLDPNNYSASLSEAIYCFVVEKDIKRAEKLLNQFKNKTTDPTWQFSLAFLKAYQGRLDYACKIYKHAFKSPPEAYVPNETEGFIEWVLNCEPEKYQLHFCMGLINMNVKNDYSLAKKDFLNFLHTAKDDTYATQIGQARVYLEEIQEREATGSVSAKSGE